MDISPIAYAIPFFFALIGVEYLVAKKKGLRAFNFHDAITDLSCGIGSRIVGVLGTVIGVGAYTAVWHFAAPLRIESGMAAWIAVFVAVDFLYYCFHRTSHRMNLIWVGHVVHHQSEEYNFAVALRQSWYLQLVEWIFYLPLALVGFSPMMYLTARAFNSLYQFWIHTETIGSLGPLERVFNTPSHHRVHHGTNPEYIDKNYGGILIVWDRMFGTFEPEHAHVVYGTIKPVQSWNPLWVNVADWVEMGRNLRRASNMRERAQVVFGPPGWTPDGIPEPPAVSRASQRKYDVESTFGVDVYVAANYLVAIAGTTAYMVFQSTATPVDLAIGGGWILAGVVAWGGLFEGRSWALHLELARLGSIPAAVWWFTATPAAAAAGGVIALVGALLLFRARSSQPAVVPTRYP